MASKRSRYELNMNVYEAAKMRIKRLYGMYDKVVVNYSGGKDSIAMLYLTTEVAEELGRLPVDAIYFDHEIEGLGTVEIVKQTYEMSEVDLKVYAVPFRQRNACSTLYPYWYAWHPEEKHLWVRPKPSFAITEVPGLELQLDPNWVHPDGLPFRAGAVKSALIMQTYTDYLDAEHHKKGNSVVNLIGLRAQESFARYQALTASRECWLGPRGAYPLYDWTANDVWKYIRDTGKPYNLEYELDNKTRLANKLNKQRVGAIFGEESLRGLDLLPEKYGEYWHRILDRVEGAATAWRYNNDGIYKGKGKDVKPDGMSWEQYVNRKLEDFPPQFRGNIVKQINGMIRYHKSQTDYVIPDSEADTNPLTGMSWEYIAQIVIRGDAHGRTAGKRTLQRVKAQSRLNMTRDEAVAIYGNQKYNEKYARDEATRRATNASFTAKVEASERPASK